LFMDGIELDVASTISSGTPGTPSNNPILGVGNIYLDITEASFSNAVIWSSDQTANVTEIYNNGTPASSYTDSPILWWELNNLTSGLDDLSGNGNNAITSGPVFTVIQEDIIAYQLGVSNGLNTTSLVQSNLTKKQPFSSYSINFDYAGGDYSQTTPGTNSILSGSTSCTISAWVNFSDIDSGAGLKPIATNWDASASSYNYILRYFQDQFQFYIFTTSNGTTNFDFVPDLNTWYNIVATWGDGTGVLKLYLNGVDQNVDVTKTGTMPIITTSDKVSYYRSGSTDYYMDGALSNVAIWKDTALLEDDILNIYNNGVSQNLSNFSIPPTAWYPMDQSNTYFNGTTLVSREVISSRDSTGENIIQENIVGNAPGSTGNAISSGSTDFNLLNGDSLNSINNSYSINMADYAGPGVTNPADSGQSTNVP